MYATIEAPFNNISLQRNPAYPLYPTSSHSSHQQDSPLQLNSVYPEHKIHHEAPEHAFIPSIDLYVPQCAGDDCVFQYRAEGGANIVVSVPATSLILRLPKQLSAFQNDNREQYASSILSQLQRCVQFRTSVVAPLLSSRVQQGVLCVSEVPRCRLVRLSLKQQNTLVRHIEDQRPAFRRGYTVNSAGLALLADDCTALPSSLDLTASRPHYRRSPVISVEIKPKQGFLSADDDLGVCAYCMKQYSKLHHGSIRRISRYCPLDLFSGCALRFRHAFSCLLQDPQNNLRVFVDGECVLSSGTAGDRSRLFAVLAGVVGADRPPADLALREETVLNMLSDLLFAALNGSSQVSPACPAFRVPGAKVEGNIACECRDCNNEHARISFNDIPKRGWSVAHHDVQVGWASWVVSSAAVNSPPSWSSMSHTRKCCREGGGPRMGSFLDRVLRMQRLSMPGLATAASLFLRLKSCSLSRARLNYVFSDCSFSDPSWTRLVTSAGSEIAESSQQDTVESDIMKLQQYSVAATVRDCSIMVALQKIPHHPDTSLPKIDRHLVQDAFGQSWLALCRLVDLDPKPIDRVLVQSTKNVANRQHFLQNSARFS